ncbi:hypothetical protein ACA910_010006 [Epithemia clementina (nom. ined.)]
MCSFGLITGNLYNFLAWFSSCLSPPHDAACLEFSTTTPSLSLCPFFQLPELVLFDQQNEEAGSVRAASVYLDDQRSEPNSKPRRWTPEESARIRHAVETEKEQVPYLLLCNMVQPPGLKRGLLDLSVGDRLPGQLHDRFKNHVDPNWKKGPFSLEVKAILFKADVKWATAGRR